jgi:hypothetical protein
MSRLPSVLSAAVLGVAAFSAFASCGSGSGSADPSDLSPTAKAKWDEYCAFEAACQPASPCPSSACMALIAEEEPLIEFVDCQSAKACGANDDDCVASAGTTDAERDAFTPRCVAALSAGQAPPDCYVESALCTIVAYPLIRKRYMRAVDACLSLASCADRKACIDKAIAPLNCF